MSNEPPVTQSRPGKARFGAALAGALAELRRAAPKAAAETKALFARAAFGDDFIADAAGVFARAVRGGEAAEGFAAFLSNTKPGWAQ